MKKLAVFFLALLLLTSSSCNSKSTFCDNLQWAVEAVVTDKTTKKIKTYLESYLFREDITVKRESAFDKKLIIHISSNYTEIYRFGRFVEDCISLCKSVVNDENQTSFYISIYILKVWLSIGTQKILRMAV